MNIIEARLDENAINEIMRFVSERNLPMPIDCISSWRDDTERGLETANFRMYKICAIHTLNAYHNVQSEVAMRQLLGLGDGEWYTNHKPQLLDDGSVNFNDASDYVLADMYDRPPRTIVTRAYKWARKFYIESGGNNPFIVTDNDVDKVDSELIKAFLAKMRGAFFPDGDLRLTL